MHSEDIDISDIGFSDAELVALLADESEPDWSEFDCRLAALEKEGYALLPVKIRPEMKEAMQAALMKRAAEKGLNDKDKAVLTGKVIQELLEIKV